MAGKVCPLLTARGILLNEQHYKITKEQVTETDDYWLKICISECPLETCIFEIPGRVRRKDEERLMEVA